MGELRNAERPETVMGRLETFNEDKGYGFISHRKGGRDMLVHRHAFTDAGISMVPPPGTVLRCLMEQGPKGPYAVRILGIASKIDDWPELGPDEMRLRRDIPAKGYGFFSRDDGVDVFVLRSSFRIANIEALEGRTYKVWYRATDRGYTATRVEQVVRTN